MELRLVDLVKDFSGQRPLTPAAFQSQTENSPDF